MQVPKTPPYTEEGESPFSSPGILVTVTPEEEESVEQEAGPDDDSWEKVADEPTVLTTTLSPTRTEDKLSTEDAIVLGLDRVDSFGTGYNFGLLRRISQSHKEYAKMDISSVIESVNKELVRVVVSDDTGGSDDTSLIDKNKSIKRLKMELRKCVDSLDVAHNLCEMEYTWIAQNARPALDRIDELEAGLSKHALVELENKRLNQLNDELSTELDSLKRQIDIKDDLMNQQGEMIQSMSVTITAASIAASDLGRTASTIDDIIEEESGMELDEDVIGRHSSDLLMTDDQAREMIESAKEARISAIEMEKSVSVLLETNIEMDDALQIASENIDDLNEKISELNLVKQTLMKDLKQKERVIQEMQIEVSDLQSTNTELEVFNDQLQRELQEYRRGSSDTPRIARAGSSQRNMKFKSIANLSLDETGAVPFPITSRASSHLLTGLDRRTPDEFADTEDPRDILIRVRTNDSEWGMIRQNTPGSVYGTDDGISKEDEVFITQLLNNVKELQMENDKLKRELDELVEVSETASTLESDTASLLGRKPRSVVSSGVRSTDVEGEQSCYNDVRLFFGC